MTDLIISDSKNIEGKNLAIPFTYEEAKTLKKEATWKNLAAFTVGQAIDTWLGTLPNLTAKNYACGMRKLTAGGLIDPGSTLQSFALVNHDHALDLIKGCPASLNVPARPAPRAISALPVS